MDKDRALELKLALATKRKFRGLSAKEIHTIIGKIKEKNNGTLVGLKLAAFMALVKKEIHKKNEAKADEYKQECREKSVTCDICYYKFSNQSAKNRHMIRKHGQNRQEVKEKDTSEYIEKCPHCKRCFKYDFSLKYHVERFHSQIAEDHTQLVCQKCDKVFKHKTSLKRHLEGHSESENFVCERCDAEFTRKDSLLKHKKRVHSLAKVNLGMIRKETTKDYICKMCTKNFGRDSNKYEAHLVLRVCQQTEEHKKYKLDDNLMFACDQCDKTYKEKDSLQRHVRWKHNTPVNPFKCLECNISFKYKSTHNRHLRTKHGRDV